LGACTHTAAFKHAERTEPSCALCSAGMNADLSVQGWLLMCRVATHRVDDCGAYRAREGRRDGASRVQRTNTRVIRAWSRRLRNFERPCNCATPVCRRKRSALLFQPRGHLPSKGLGILQVIGAWTRCTSGCGRSFVREYDVRRRCGRGGARAAAVVLELRRMPLISAPLLQRMQTCQPHQCL
jgi:hypothetical protein